MNSYSRPGFDFDQIKSLRKPESTSNLARRLRENAALLHRQEAMEKKRAVSKSSGSDVSSELNFKVILPDPEKAMHVPAQYNRVVKELTKGERLKFNAAHR